MKRPFPIFAVLFMALAVPFGSGANAAIINFDTSTSPFTPGVDNQGWWSPTLGNSTTNDNYFVGRLSGQLHNNFFTFDLSSLNLAGQQVVSATLQLTRYSSGGDATHTFNLFDVSTDAATLNNNSGTNAAIFNDLGSGVQYGSFVVGTGSFIDVLSFSLNAAALSDITAAAGGFFSIGGTLDLSGAGGGDQFLFGFSGSGGTQRLVLEVEPAAAIPEPASLAVFGLVGLAAAGYARRRRKAAVA